MKFVKNVFNLGNDEIEIIDIIPATRCYACGAECNPNKWHPTLYQCDAGHTVEIPCADWFIIFTVRPKKEIKIQKIKPIGKTKVGRGSWTPESENDTNLRFNEQLLKFDYLHEIDWDEVYGIYLVDLINAVTSFDATHQ
jgi:hypothetical protein